LMKMIKNSVICIVQSYHLMFIRYRRTSDIS
jgi:hypothetical protein